MSILCDEKKRIFTIHTDHTTYQMMAERHDRLLHLYYGRKTQGQMDYLITPADRGFSGYPYDVGCERTYSLDILPQEYPSEGTGDFRSPALIVRDEHGTSGVDLKYVSYTIEDGKYGLCGLPAVYASAEAAQTLTITLEDKEAGIRVELLYGVLPEYDIITRAERIINTGDKKFYLDKALTANLDFFTGNFDMITFYGRHAMERNFQRAPLLHGEQTIGSRRGTSSHQYNPMVILCDHDATEMSGTCYSMQFVYSGGFAAMAGIDQVNGVRMQMGLASHDFYYPVEAGSDFLTPEVIMSCSVTGLADLSNNLQACIRKHVIRGKWRDQIRPVLLNSWEACYFDFDGTKICELAEQAKMMGLDMLVLDDGWFGKRDDDNSGLGDWYVNEKKLGGSLHELVECIHGMGLKFGIWVEPEMVNEDSDLFRAHPDWALAIPGRKPIRGRNQLVLDFSRREIVDKIFEDICKVIDAGPVDYIKWDYNRSISEVYTSSGKEQGTVLYDYILGLYDFLERLNQKYPSLLIEGCSGGGGRFDAGMLYYTPQIWCSDNSESIDRLRIQYGTSFGYPVNSVGAHVSACPNEQNGRVTPIHTRAVVAMSGTFGYELDPTKMSDEDKAEVRGQVEGRKKYASLISFGKYYRLTSPFDDEIAAWEFVSEDGSEALVNIVTLTNHGNCPTWYIKLAALTPDALYVRDDADGDPQTTYGSDALMQTGLPLPLKFGEYLAYQWHFTRK